MLDYIKEPRLRLMGPDSMFPSALFSSPMLLRDINSRVVSDCERSEGKFCRPVTIVGKENFTSKVVATDKHDFVVEVLYTPESLLTVWQDDVVKPLWRVRVVRDPDNKSRGLKELCIYGPQYTLGKIGSGGPFQTLVANKATILDSWRPPVTTETTNTDTKT